MGNMEIDMKQAYQNYANLSDAEKETIRKFMAGPARRIIGKVFGDEFDTALGAFMLPKAKRGKGLASQQ